MWLCDGLGSTRRQAGRPMPRRAETEERHLAQASLWGCCQNHVLCRDVWIILCTACSQTKRKHSACKAFWEIVRDHARVCRAGLRTMCDNIVPGYWSRAGIRRRRRSTMDKEVTCACNGASRAPQLGNGCTKAKHSWKIHTFMYFTRLC